MDLQKAFDEGFGAVKDYVDDMVADLAKRLSAIENRVAPASVANALIDRAGNLVLTFSDGSTKELGLVVGKDGVDAIGNDGIGLAGAIINSAGHLVVTLSDGTAKELGVVVGQDVDQIAVERRITELVDAIPPARDGVDGLGFDDLTAEYDGERGITLRFARGEQEKEFAFAMPVVIDRGVWVEAKTNGYAKGDGVTWAGSFWISQKDGNADKPDGGDGWRLSVKRGRDGKDAVVRDMSPKPVKVG